MRTLLITRPIAQAEETAALVEKRCPGVFRPVISPLTRIVSEKPNLDLTGVQALLFSSRNGVMEFASRSAERGLPALCVGDGTARAASSLGFSAESADGDAAALARLAAMSYLEGGGHFLHLRGRETSSDVIGALAAEGIPAEDAILYEQISEPLNDFARQALATPGPLLAPIYSPNSAARFTNALAAYDGPLRAQITALAISSAATEPLEDAPVAAIYMSAAANGASMIDGIASL